jgi:hypothetical protein
MMVLYGTLAVAVVWGLAHAFAQANPAGLARLVRVLGAMLALGIAVLLGLRGRIDLALGLAGLGAWLLGWNGLSASGRVKQAPGRVSTVRSSLLEMTLDHDTGEMEGVVLAGTGTGRRLGSLDRASLQGLLAQCRTEDPDGVRLLEAYLDRRFPGWREADRQREPPPGGQAASGIMTEDEAHQILGLQPGAGPEAIRQAHRSLMKKLHPDQGGSTYLAARVN